MPFPSSRIPGPGARKASKPSFLAPPTAGASAARAQDASASSSRSSRVISSPMKYKHPTKRLQFPSSHQQPSNQTAATLEEQRTPSTKPPVCPAPLRTPDATAMVSSLSISSTTESDNIRVLLRIRPTGSSDKQPGSGRCLEVAPDRKGVTLAPSSQQERRFGFDHVFPESTEQDEIFQDAGRAAVENTIKGYNGSIFAYGQTGSGKTFTMLGGSSASAGVHELRKSPLRGLTPRILDYLFRRLAALSRERNAGFLSGEEAERALEYTLACSYLEIYNEKVFDLLEPSGSQGCMRPKSLREDRNKEVYVDQLREIEVCSEEEALTLLQLGGENRHMASTDMNRESSRSHAVFTVKLVLAERTSAGVRRTRRSCLHLVDLAGSEKQRQTHAKGQRLKEAAQINKSLSALGNVIMSLVDVSNGQKRHVHYRDSKLTFLLRDALGGNAITSIVATISAEEKYFTETLSTLKFAQRAKFIKNKAVQNEDADSLVPVLKQEIEKLQLEIQALRTNSSSSTASLSSVEAEGESPAKHEHLLRLQAIAEAEAAARAQEKKRQNRWEPALDMMQKLLRASGAMAPTDVAKEKGTDEPQQEEQAAVEARCDRLEMLLYRMICRFEEYKEMAYTPDRYRSSSRHSKPGGRIPKPSKLPAPRTSMLQAPRKYLGAVGRHRLHHVDNQEQEQSADDDEAAAAIAAAEKRERQLQNQVEEHQRREEELRVRSEEAEAENDLIRHELCELLEWKAFVEEERRQGHEALAVEPPQEQEDNNSNKGDKQQEDEKPTTLPSEEMQELQELLNVYRSLFDDVTELVDTKKPILCAPRSPKSGSSVVTEDNSVSYASGDEDDTGDDNVSVDGMEPSEEGESGVSDTYQEIRRAHALNSRLERKLDRYQDAIQRLEKDLQASQDELETSSAATKFAEFQLQQLRTLAADDESKQLEAERQLREQLEMLEGTVRLQRDEVTKLLDEKAVEDLRTLRHEQQVTQQEVEHLETSLRQGGGRVEDEEKEKLEKALQVAQERLDTLQSELQEAEQASLGSEDATAEPTKDESAKEASAHVQTLLVRALGDNKKLLATVRDLQGKRQRSDGNLELLSSLLTAATTGKKVAKDDEKDKENEEAVDQVAQLKQELEELQSRQRVLSDFDDARSRTSSMASAVSAVDSEALANPVETIQRLAQERVTLRKRLRRSQQTTSRLELELRRMRQSAAVSSTNGELSTAFLCGM